MIFDNPKRSCEIDIKSKFLLVHMFGAEYFVRKHMLTMLYEHELISVLYARAQSLKVRSCLFVVIWLTLVIGEPQPMSLTY